MISIDTMERRRGRQHKPHIFKKPSGYWGFKCISPRAYDHHHPFAKARAFVNKMNGELRKQNNENWRQVCGTGDWDKR